MGKKNRNVHVKYDPNALKNLGNKVRDSRRELKEESLTKLQVDLEKLELTIKELPKKEREILEKYWGLIPGTMVKHDHVLKKMSTDISARNMKIAADSAMQKLTSMENLCKFDMQARKLAQNLLSKMDRNGIEASDMDMIRYLILFLVFFVGGPNMMYEAEGEANQLSETEERISCVDHYTMLQVSWESYIGYFPDNSINMKLLLSAIDMFDCKDVAYMKKYVGLEISKDFQNEVFDPLETFRELRLFKERLFCNGEWKVTTHLILHQATNPIKLTAFEIKLRSLKKNRWKKFDDYRQANQVIKTSKGLVILPTYEIGGLMFTDSYEVQFLSVAL